MLEAVILSLDQKLRTELALQLQVLISHHQEKFL